MVYMALAAVGVAYTLWRTFRAVRMRKRIGEQLVSGTSQYKSLLFTMVCGVIIPAVLTIEGLVKYAYLAALLVLEMICAEQISRFYLGTAGLKVSDEFIPRERWVGYHIDDGHRPTVHVHVGGKERPIPLILRNTSEITSFEQAWNQASSAQ
ncbi:hypothetical protein O9H85_29020 [Paenibacillus filicis]|uniref:DUF5673 domain-containing protein n=1 Tax=Paenibacillus gyeongsangnamensis TaxID=3388067 RepID=A0ABT4QHM4_9BACL|nr:hypothetical protein [Paenibacillus filicis]MCZ8516362.1 hypothetical protein [Paenibacillus filicis]